MADKRISQLIERVDIANNDVLPIVASGATTTNKVTISTLQDWMQDNLDVGITSVGITLGTSGTDVNVTGSPITTSGNITINIPDASASNRGVVTTGSQTFGGVKTFANGLILPSAGGTNQFTRFLNIGTIHQGSAGSNQIGFNNSNNIYFGKGLSNGGVIQWTNAAVRYYTLPDADGTIALTSQLDGYVTLGTAQTITAQKTFTTSGGDDTLIVDHTSGSGIALDISKAGNGEGLRVTKTSGSGNAMTITGGTLSAEAATFGGNVLSNEFLYVREQNASTLLANYTQIYANSTFFGFNNGAGTASAVFTYNGSGNYTLPSASGTIALTSNLSAYLPLTGGTLTGGLGGTSASFSSDVQTSTRFIAAKLAGEIRITPDLSGTTNRIESLGGLPFSLTSVGAITLAAGGVTPQITLATSGTLTMTGALNGTSASFSSTVTVDATASSWSIFKPIQLGLGAFLAGRNDDVSQVWLGANAYYDGGTNFEYKADGVATNYHQSGGSHNFQIAASGLLGNNITFTNALTIASTGNVGIGTDSPGYDGAGYGAVRYTTINNASGTGSNLELATGTTANDGYVGAVDFINTSNTGAAGAGRYGIASIRGFTTNASGTNTGGGYLTFNTKADGGSAGERMRITSGGYLKVSNNGSYINGLFNEINSNTNDQEIFYNTHSGTSPYGRHLYFEYSPNNDANYFERWRDGNATRARLYSNGGLANYQANDVNLSDERTKKDIAPLESYWDKFKAIEIVKFKYIDQTHDDFNIGVIAQQVEAVAPEFVDVDGWDTKPKLDEEGNIIVSEEEPLKSIYTADLHHATIKVLQEAMAKIEKLETEIDSLKNQIK